MKNTPKLAIQKTSDISDVNKTKISVSRPRLLTSKFQSWVQDHGLENKTTVSKTWPQSRERDHSLETKTTVWRKRPGSRDQKHSLKTKTMDSRPTSQSREQDHGLETKTVDSRPRPWTKDQDHNLGNKTTVSRTRPWSWDQDHCLETTSLPNTRNMQYVYKQVVSFFIWKRYDTDSNKNMTLFDVVCYKLNSRVYIFVNKTVAYSKSTICILTGFRHPGTHTKPIIGQTCQKIKQKNNTKLNPISACYASNS